MRLQQRLILASLLLGLPQTTHALFLGLIDFEAFGVLEFLLNPFTAIRDKKLSCVLQYLILSYEAGNFDKYEQYFRDDSAMRLKQTGVYTGPDGIAEYFSVGFQETSPYLVEGPDTISNRVRVLGYNYETQQCEFLSAQRVQFRFNEDVTGLSTKFENTVLFKVGLNYNQYFLSYIHLFYPEKFLGYFFGLEGLSSPSVQNFLCNQVLKEKCGYEVEDCEARMAALPVAEPITQAVDGNSIGCRAIHGYLATISPDLHCPHVSLDPILDPKGQLKCQETEDIPLGTLFSETDLTFFRDFQSRQGFDPDVGYRLLD